MPGDTTARRHGQPVLWCSSAPARPVTGVAAVAAVRSPPPGLGGGAGRGLVVACEPLTPLMGEGRGGEGRGGEGRGGEGRGGEGRGRGRGKSK